MRSEYPMPVSRGRSRRTPVPEFCGFEEGLRRFPVFPEPVQIFAVLVCNRREAVNLWANEQIPPLARMHLAGICG